MKDIIKKRLHETFDKDDTKKIIDSKEFEKKIEKIVLDKLKNNKEIEDKVVDITKDVLAKLYKVLWNKANMWKSAIK
jgi:hypothetical protein